MLLPLRYYRVLSRAPLALFLYVVTVQFTMAESDELWRTFLDEAPQAWEDYIELASRVQGEVSYSLMDRRTDTLIRERVYGIKLNGSLAMYTITDPGEPIRVNCANRKYDFILDSSELSNWNLLQLLWADEFESADQGGTVVTAGDSDVFGPTTWQTAMSLSCRGLLIKATWLPKMVTAPSFRIEKVRAIANGEETLVRVDFDYEPTVSANNPVRNGFVILDPSRYWLIREAKVNAYWPPEDVHGTIHFENSYDGALGFPVAIRHRLTQRTPEVHHEHTYISDFKAMDPSDTHPFTLAAFGIPEHVRPGRATGEGTRIVVWATAFVLCLLLALWLLFGDNYFSALATIRIPVQLSLLSGRRVRLR